MNLMEGKLGKRLLENGLYISSSCSLQLKPEEQIEDGRGSSELQGVRAPLCIFHSE